ncbi:MAG: hypothetical protein R3E95_15825 [Thiolinea sp.]
MKTGRSFAALAVLVIALIYQYLGGTGTDQTTPTSNGMVTSAETSRLPDQAAVVQRIRAASDNTDAKFWTTLQGEVIKNLKDDTRAAATRNS